DSTLATNNDRQCLARRYTPATIHRGCPRFGKIPSSDSLATVRRSSRSRFALLAVRARLPILILEGRNQDWFQVHSCPGLGINNENNASRNGNITRMRDINRLPSFIRSVNDLKGLRSTAARIL